MQPGMPSPFEAGKLWLQSREAGINVLAAAANSAPSSLRGNR
jgi:hypothetical protein